MKAIVLSLLIVGCGVKTAPRSSIIEVRPAIPFKETIHDTTKKSGTLQTPDQTGQAEDDETQGDQKDGTQRGY